MSLMMQNDDNTNCKIWDGKSRDLGEFTMPFDIKEDDLDLHQEVLYQNQMS
jgi:hypothetical protein